MKKLIHKLHDELMWWMQSKSNRYIEKYYPPSNKDGLLRYDQLNISSLNDFLMDIKIIVKSEEEKIQIIKALEYIDCLYEIDTNYVAVNALVHLCLNPGLIEVEKSTVTLDSTDKLL